jgi:glutamate synthase (NADPH/NADH) large chain
VLIGCGRDHRERLSGAGHLADRLVRGLLEGTLTEAVARYQKAIDQGLLKIMSKMGISVVSSYRGGLNFEAVGLSRAMVAEYFPGMISRISGIGVSWASRRRWSRRMPRLAGGAEVLPIGGFYKARSKGETHAWGAQTDAHDADGLQHRIYDLWKRYSEQLRSANPPIHLRDLLEIKPLGHPVPIEEVESITSIRKRFVTPGMSLGALSPEAHKTLNVAMNRIGAKSDSGEGGEDPAHFVPEPNGDNPSAPRSSRSRRAASA